MGGLNVGIQVGSAAPTTTSRMGHWLGQPCRTRAHPDGHTEAIGTGFCLARCLGREKKTNKHKELRRDTPTSGLQPSRGHVPFVPWKCPVCQPDILSNLCGTTHKAGRGVPDVLGFAPQTFPGTHPTHADHRSPLCVLCLSVFLLPSVVPWIIQTTMLLCLHGAELHRASLVSMGWHPFPNTLGLCCTKIELLTLIPMQAPACLESMDPCYHAGQHTAFNKTLNPVNLRIFLSMGHLATPTRPGPSHDLLEVWCRFSQRSTSCKKHEAPPLQNFFYTYI